MKKIILNLLCLCLVSNLFAGVGPYSCSSKENQVLEHSQELTFNSNYYPNWFSYTPTADGSIIFSSDETKTYDNYAEVEIKTDCNKEPVYRAKFYHGSDAIFKTNANQEYKIGITNKAIADFNWTFTIGEYIAASRCEFSESIANSSVIEHNLGNGVTQWYEYIPNSDCWIETIANTENANLNFAYKTACNDILNNIDSRVKVNANQSYFIACTNNEDSNQSFQIKELFGLDPHSAITASTNENNSHDKGDANIWFKHTATKDGVIKIQSITEASEAKFIVNILYPEKAGFNEKAGYNELSFKCSEGQTYYIQCQNLNASENYEWTLSERDFKQGDLCSNPIQVGVHTEIFTEDDILAPFWYEYTPETDQVISIEAANKDITTVIEPHATIDYPHYQFETYSNCNTVLDDDAYNKPLYVKANQTLIIKSDNTDPEFSWKVYEITFDEGNDCTTAISISTESTQTTAAQEKEWYSYTVTNYCTIDFDVLTNEGHELFFDTFLDCYTDSQVSWENNYVFSPGETVLIKASNYYNDTNWKLVTNVFDVESCSTAIEVFDGNTIKHLGGIGVKQWYKIDPQIKNHPTNWWFDSPPHALYIPNISNTNAQFKVYADCDFSNEIIMDSESGLFDFWPYYNNTFYIVVESQQEEGFEWKIEVEHLIITSVQESSSNTEITPNPAKDNFEIKTDKTITTVTIYNHQGVKVRPYVGNQTSITPNLESGLYIVSINFEDGTNFTEKLVIQ